MESLSDVRTRPQSALVSGEAKRMSADMSEIEARIASITGKTKGYLGDGLRNWKEGKEEGRCKTRMVLQKVNTVNHLKIIKHFV